MTSKSQKERAQKVIPGGTKKKGELRKVFKWHQKSKRKSTWDSSHVFYEKWAGHVSEQVSEQVSGQDFMQNWNLFGLRGDFPYCKRFVLAGTKRQPSKQSLWEKLVRNPTPQAGTTRKIINYPWFFLEFFAKTSIFELPRPRRSFPAIRELMKHIPDRFRYKNMFLQARTTSRAATIHRMMEPN